MKRNDYFENIKKIFKQNFRLTRLYAMYLENVPDVITEELITDITKDGIDTPDAVSAVLSELFGLDLDNSAEDRQLFRDYLCPSVRILDPKKYTDNPYYKNIKLKEAKLGEWEIKKEVYKPYRGVIAGDMQLSDDFTEIPPLGFFKEEFEFPAVLEGGNEWMTLTPVDLDTCEKEIEAAHGNVITFGLGLGYYTYMVSQKPSVEKITVIEKSPDVIRLFKEEILPQFSFPEKVEIIEADAFEYAEWEMPKRHFDVAFVDTWRDASDGSEMYCRMKPLERLNPETKFYYWIENFIISRLRAIKFEELNILNSLGRLDKTKDEIIKELTDIDKLIK